MFSVIIPYFNKANYIQRCIDSVLNQSFVDFEIIIVNDGSTDKGLQFLSALDSQKIIVINQINKGVSEARNTGIKNAKNKYIAFLDADDCWHFDYLNAINQVVNNESDVTIIGANYSRSSYFLIQKNAVLDYFEFDDYFKVAIKNTYFTSSSTVINSSFFQLNNGFNATLKSGEDSDVWFRAVQSGGNAFYINNTLVYYSDEDENQTTKTKQHLNNSLVGNIIFLYKDLAKSDGNSSFGKFIKLYVYFNLYPYYFDKQYNNEAKIILKQNKNSFFWLRLPYFLPVSVGEKLLKLNVFKTYIRLYLKFIIRYIYT